MKRHIALFALGALLIAPWSAPARAASLPDTPVGAEVALAWSVQADLMKRFPTAAVAERAGFFRYTDEDNTGAISYTNGQWQTTDKRKPTQLWYDLKGKLLGVDFSVLRAEGSKAPVMWGVSPQRWQKFPAHIHFIATKSDGTLRYGDLSTADYEKAGGNADDPTAAPLVKAGIVKDAGVLKRICGQESSREAIRNRSQASDVKPTGHLAPEAYEWMNHSF